MMNKMVPTRGCVTQRVHRQDMEVECDRFEASKEATMGKYSYLELPRGTVQQQADLAVDTLACLIGVCCCLIGLRAGTLSYGTMFV